MPKIVLAIFAKKALEDKHVERVELFDGLGRFHLANGCFVEAGLLDDGPDWYVSSYTADRGGVGSFGCPTRGVDLATALATAITFTRSYNS